MFALLVSALLAPTAQNSDPLYRAFPVEVPGAVLSSPDWSDFRIYPKAAADHDQEGRVAIEALIGPDGEPKLCRITESSSFPDLDKGTCDLVMQMRFQPAHDALGKAVESTYQSAVNWRLTDPLPFASATLKLRVWIKNQQLARCEMEGAEGPYTRLWTTTACSYFNDVPYFFGTHAGDDAMATIEARLDAGDNAVSLKAPWTSGTPVAHETVAFSVTASGDPSNCTQLERSGFGPRGIRTMSPCGPLLAILYFRTDEGSKAPVRQGTFETRIYLRQRNTP